MLYAILATLLLGLIFLPQLWVLHVMRKHAADRLEFRGTGGELARHLLDEADLGDVLVETTEAGDHYDPDARAVRLTSANFNRKSITALAVAAHEVSHAVQHARGETLFDWRGRLVRLLLTVDWIAGALLILAPIIAVVVRSPILLVGQFVLIIGLLTLRVIVHLVTLPVETDASFRKALPVLEQGGYLAAQDMPAARQVLRAAAFTYVAAALMSIVDILRLLRFGR